MASYMSAGSRFSLVMANGTNPNGNPKTITNSISGLDAGAAAADVLDTATALAALCNGTVKEVLKTDKDLVTA